MAAIKANNGRQQRKSSFSSSFPLLLNRSKAASTMTDQTLIGVLNNIIRMEGSGQTFIVKAILPDGKPKLLSGDRDMTIRDLVSGIRQEYNLGSIQVRVLPQKTLISLDTSATAVENGEVAIEDGDRRLSNFELDNLHTIRDPKLRCVKELLHCIETYLNYLKCVFELYAEPFKKWGLGTAEYHTLFSALERIYGLSETLHSKLQEAANQWNPDKTAIGRIFGEHGLLWVSYGEYYVTFRFAMKLLREKREQDGSFMSFVNSQRGSSKQHLEGFLLKPAQHVVDCERILANLLDKTPDSHPDHDGLEQVVDKFRQMAREKDEEVASATSECKMIEIQDKFPHDPLFLNDRDPLQRFKSAVPRRRSAPASAIKKTTSSGKTNSVKCASLPEGGGVKGKSPSEHTPCATRGFVREGPVQLSSGVSTQERYFFLFKDLLCVAKPKSASNFKLKQRIRLSEIWLASCTDDLCESIKSRDKSFVIGWPTTNFVATFSTCEEKESWHSDLSRYLKEQKELEEPKNIALKVYNRDMDSADSCHYSKSFTITNTENASDVVKTSVEQFQIQDASTDYQLWVLSGKEEGPYPLIGHEFPFAIKMNHIRESAVEDGFPFDFDHLPSMEPLLPETQCQFILKKIRKDSSGHSHSTNSNNNSNINNNKIVVGEKANVTVIASDGHRETKRWKNPIKKSPIINWAMHKRTPTVPKGQCMDTQSSSPGKLFGLPLAQLCSEEEPVPRQVQELLLNLFRYGPAVTGIFRKTANARVTKEVKQRLDEGKDLPFDVPVVVSSSVFREFLRRLPDCVLISDNYEDIVATNLLLDDENERVRQLKLIIEGLPLYNQELLKRFFCVLFYIAKHADTNNMNTYNLARCVAPSLLWPPLGSGIPPEEQMKAVPLAVQFAMENSPKLFGEDVKTALGDPTEIDFASDSESTHESRGHSSTDDGIESPEPLSPKAERNSLHSSDTNIYASAQAERLTVRKKVQSASTPNSPCDSGVPSPNTSPQLKRHDDFSSQLKGAFYEPNSVSDRSPHCRRRSDPFDAQPESLKIRIRGSRKSPRFRRKLSSTTTSAELIEHKQAPKTTASGRRLETAVLRRAHSPQTVHLFPVTPNVTHYQRLNPSPTFPVSRLPQIDTATEIKPSLESGALSSNYSEGNVTGSLNSPGPRCPSPTPDQVFEAVDRRKQPAAPSYHEHMQRMREGGSKVAFYQGRETAPPTSSKDLDATRESISQREFRDQLEIRIANRSEGLPSSGNGSPRHERLDSSGHSEPNTPSSPHELSWDNPPREDASNTRRLEHSPFSLNLHHKRAGSEGGLTKRQLIEPGKRGLVVTTATKTTVNSNACLTFSLGNTVNSTHSHFPQSELFPHEAQAKSLWNSSPETSRLTNAPPESSRLTSALPETSRLGSVLPETSRLTSASPETSRLGSMFPETSRVANVSPMFHRRRGSQTSSSSSVSSSDDRCSVGADSSVSEGKPHVTQIRDIKDLLNQQSQANGLKISPQTAQEIARVREPWAREQSTYTPPTHDDIEKMMFTEESYV